MAENSAFMEVLVTTIGRNGTDLSLEITKRGIQPREAVLMLSVALFSQITVAAPADRNALRRIALMTLRGEHVDG